MAVTEAMPATTTGQGLTLEKKLIFEQAEPILDAVATAGDLLVLSPGRVALYTRPSGSWELRQSATWAPLKPWPRDLRGHLRRTGSSFQAYLPGMTCSGTVEPALAMDCRPSEDPWVLESGSRAIMLAVFTPARNYFDGRVTTQTGVRKTVGPFFSAAAVEDQGRQLWLLAAVDGHTQVFDSAFEPGGVVGSWGSDLAGTTAPCGGGSQVLVTRPGDGREADAVRAYGVVGRVPVPLSAAVDFPGSVTALWSEGAAAVMVITRDTETGRFGAYRITVSCGP